MTRVWSSSFSFFKTDDDKNTPCFHEKVVCGVTCNDVNCEIRVNVEYNRQYQAFLGLT